VYPALFSYVAFQALLNAVLGFQNSKSHGYFYSYFFLEPLSSLFGFMAVRELFTLIFGDYPGIRTAGRWTMYAGVSIAVIISLLATVWTGRVHASHGLFYLEICQRWIDVALALVIVAIVLFISRYPLHLSRNTLFSCAFFAAIFLGDAVRLFLDNRARYLYNHYVDLLETAFECACLLTWAVLLKPRDDDKATPPLASRLPREEYLLHQIKVMNRLLAQLRGTDSALTSPSTGAPQRSSSTMIE
jgi:hypothetical protein